MRRWVPVGTPVADAQRIMEKHGFTVYTNDVNFFRCSYEGPASNWVETTGLASFAFKDGNVSTQQVSIYFKGP